jgi:hypothetical protein
VRELGTDKCEVPRCKRDGAIKYYERWVCDYHWVEYMADGKESDALKHALGIINEVGFVGQY